MSLGGASMPHSDQGNSLFALDQSQPFNAPVTFQALLTG